MYSETLTDGNYVYADILIALAQADQHVDEREKELLNEIFANMGLDSQTIEGMWLTPRTLDVIQSLLADVKDNQFKHCLLKDCYLLAYADEEVVPEESAFIKCIQQVMQVEKATLDAIHDWVKTALDQKKKAEELFGAPL